MGNSNISLFVLVFKIIHLLCLLFYVSRINNDWSFDDEAALQYGCNVRAFDPRLIIKNQFKILTY